MNNKDLMKYIYEQRRIGKSNKQIATSLGMSMKHFMKEVGEVIGPKDDKKEEPKKPVETPKAAEKPAEDRPQVETGQSYNSWKKDNNFDWMD